MAFRRYTSAVLVVAGSMLIASAGSAKTTKPTRVYADFGYVIVDPLDEKAAIEEGAAAQEAAERVFLLHNAHFALVEEGLGGNRWSSLSNGYIVYSWPFPNGSRKFASHPSPHDLRHEIGHDLLARYLIPRSSDGEYGTDAPDWLDEMAAIAFEGAEQQSNRQQVARMEADRVGLLPLERLMTMVHPEFRTRLATASDTAFTTAQPTSKDTVRFYSTIRVFYDYLIAKTGDRAIVAHLAAAYRRGDNLKTWIVDRLRPKGEGDSLEAVNANLLRWFDIDPRYKQ